MCSFCHRIHTVHSSYKIRITLLITIWQLNLLDCVDKTSVYSSPRIRSRKS
jgi:hypothetical protein